MSDKLPESDRDFLMKLSYEAEIYRMDTRTAERLRQIALGQMSRFDPPSNDARKDSERLEWLIARSYEPWTRASIDLAREGKGDWSTLPIQRGGTMTEQRPDTRYHHFLLGAVLGACVSADFNPALVAAVAGIGFIVLFVHSAHRMAKATREAKHGR